MKSSIDLHLHTLVSDGNATPLEMLQPAKELGLAQISITDHDALGAYRHWGDLFARAKELGIELVSGIELDADFRRRELHLLGYGFNVDDPALNRHLAATQRIRKQRVRLQLAIINQFFKRKVVDSRKVFLPQRDTLMKPHLVHAMIDQGLFADYRQAAGWLSDIARVQIHVPKLPLPDAIAMIRNAGGEAILAHPGYMVKETDISLASSWRNSSPSAWPAWRWTIPITRKKSPASRFPTWLPSRPWSPNCANWPSASI